MGVGLKRSTSTLCLTHGMAGLDPVIHVYPYSADRKTWMPGTRPGTTTLITAIRPTSAKLRPPTNCQQLSSSLQPGRIVEKPLAKDLVAAPFLQGDLVDAVHLACVIGEFENPVNRNVVAFDQAGDRLGIDVRHPRQHAALMGDQQVAADARGCGVLLHAGILGVIALDGAGMIAAFDHGDEFIQTGPR